MAASDDLPITFHNVCDNSFYFETPESDFQEDAFRCSPQHPKPCWIQSMDRKFLVLKTSEDFGFQDRNSEERQQSDCKFKIQIYHDSTSHTQPVMLYTDKSPDQVMVVCCSDDKKVTPKRMDIGSLKNIDAKKHQALFYWRKISSDKYTFESTFYERHFLAFEPLNDYSCMHKLILLHLKGEWDEVDESRNIIVTQQEA